MKWRFSPPIHSPASSADHKALPPPPPCHCLGPVLVLWDVVVIYSPAHRGGDPQCGHVKQISQLSGLPLHPIMCKSPSPVSGQEGMGSGVTSSGTASSDEPPSAFSEAHRPSQEIFMGSGFIWGCLAKCHPNPPTLSSRNVFSLLTVQTLFPLSAQQVGGAALPT